MKDKVRQFAEAAAALPCAQSFSLHEAELLAPHTTFRIGGPADLFAEVTSCEALQALLAIAKHHSLRTLVMGRGSNLLFDDRGYRGLVISTAAMRSVSVKGNTLTADAGASLMRCANAALAAGLTGLEFAHGIPGSIGGAVYMNAGAYGGEMADVVVATTVYDTESDTVRVIPATEHAFGYRTSVFCHSPHFIILSTALQLQCGDKTAIKAQMDALMQRRLEKQPLEYPSAGSTFKRYPGRFTGQMIEEAGLKGYTVGGAQVSEKHAGFIINCGGATSRDVLALIGYVTEQVAERFGVRIEPEVVYVPEA